MDTFVVSSSRSRSADNWLQDVSRKLSKEFIVSCNGLYSWSNTLFLLLFIGFITNTILFIIRFKIFLRKFLITSFTNHFAGIILHYTNSSCTADDDHLLKNARKGWRNSKNNFIPLEKNNILSFIPHILQSKGLCHSFTHV